MATAPPEALRGSGLGFCKARGYLEEALSLTAAEQLVAREAEAAAAAAAAAGESRASENDDDGPEAAPRQRCDEFLARLTRGFRVGVADEREHAKKVSEAIVRIEKWRSDVGADALLRKALPAAAKFHKAWPAFTYGRSGYGHLLLVERLSDLDVGALSDGSIALDDMLLCRAQCLEAWSREKRLNSQRLGHRSYKHVSVLDVTGLSLSHLTSTTRAVLQAVIRLSSEYYVESMFRMLIINAPLAFRAVWAIVQPWLPERSRVKVKIFGGPDQYVPALKELKFDLDALPVEMGGTHEARTFEDLVNAALAEAQHLVDQGKDFAELIPPPPPMFSPPEKAT